MFSKPDIRFKATCSGTTKLQQVLFPLRVRVSRHSAGLALAEARSVVEQLVESAEEVEIPAARLEIPEFHAPGGKHGVELTIEQVSKKEVRLDLMLTALLTLEESGDVWSQALAVAAATDFLQNFSQRPREKDIEVDIQQGKVLTGGATATREQTAGPA
jgi:hypothetical protein